MAYNIKSALNGIYNEKGNWVRANQAGDTEAQNIAASNAQKYYDQLIKGGYQNVADQLKSANYEQAKTIVDNFTKQTSPTKASTSVNMATTAVKGTSTPAKTNASPSTATRPYLYYQGASAGLSHSDIDNLVGWNDATGEVTFNGSVVGKPDEVRNGVSYWNDTSALDNALNNYVNQQAEAKKQAELKAQQEKEAAEKYERDKVAKTGKSATRDYFYSLGTAYGLSPSDVDKLISWDNQTGEVTFGGKKIGTPDVVVDGVSYWSDTSVLDNAFKDYVNRSGLTKSNDQLMAQHNTEIQDKVNNLYGLQTSDRQMMTDKYGKLEDTAYSNPFESDEAKAILGKYDLSALQGRNNAVASGGSSNGGNIDSYAAANALRQQAALVNQGQMAVLDAHNNKINNVKGILSDLGIYLQNQDVGMQNTIGLQQSEAQRLFENDQTSKLNADTLKNNEVARLSEQASVTGYTPTEWTIANNDVYRQFLNSDGTFKKEMEDVDIQALINAAKEKGDTKTANDLAVVRARKMWGDYAKYGQYLNDGDIAFMSNGRTEAGNQFDQTMAYNYKTLENKNAGTSLSGRVRSSGSSSSGGSGKTTYTGKLTPAQTKDLILAGVITEETIAAANHHFGTEFTMENPPKIVDGQVVLPGEEPEEKNKKAPLSAKEVTEWVDYFNNYVDTNYAEKGLTALKETGKNKYEPADLDSDFIIISVYGDSDLTQEQKDYLLYEKLGISEDEVNAALRDPHYR